MVTIARPVVMPLRACRLMKTATIEAPTSAGTAYISRSRSSEGTSLTSTSRTTPPPTAVITPSAAEAVRPRPYS